MIIKVFYICSSLIWIESPREKKENKRKEKSVCMREEKTLNFFFEVIHESR
jgi:hypothetical protein